jgi:hypothetical protein
MEKDDSDFLKEEVHHLSASISKSFGFIFALLAVVTTRTLSLPVLAHTFFAHTKLIAVLPAPV